MVKIEGNETWTSEKLSGDPYFMSGVQILKDVDSKLEHLLGKITTEITFHDQSALMQHGRGPSYFNSKVLIAQNKNTIEQKNISDFTLSCFPNCCGVGIVTSNYHQYSQPFNLDNLNSMEFTIKLITAISVPIGYKSLLLTITDSYKDYYTAIKKVLETQGAKLVNQHQRKGSGGLLYTYTINREQFTESKELLNYLNIKPNEKSIHEKINAKVEKTNVVPTVEEVEF